MELVTISRGGSTIVKHVWATIDVTSEPVAGSISVPAHAALGVGDRFQIETLDGRRATILVETSALGSLDDSLNKPHGSTKPLAGAKEPCPKPYRPQRRVTFVLEGSLTQ